MQPPPVMPYRTPGLPRPTRTLVPSATTAWRVGIGVALVTAAVAPWRPRPVSRGSTGCRDASFEQGWAILTNAIDLYQTEHGGRPPPAADLARQLTLPTDAAGNVAAG